MNRTFQLTHEVIIKFVNFLVYLSISFEICYLANLSLPWCMVVSTIFFIIGSKFYLLCQYVSQALLNRISQNLPIDKECIQQDLMQQQFVQFKQQFSQEHLAAIEQRTIAEQEKLQKVLDYTRLTFRRLDFSEAEIFMICKSVEYLITHNTVLKSNDISIAFKPGVTQISLKNFAWNISNQYHLRGLLTAEFVITTFDQWFKESTITTIAKNLRTTTGNHAVEIDEHICR